MTRPFRSETVLAALAVIAVCACGHRKNADVRQADPPVPSPGDSVFFQVTNENYYDTRLYIVYEGGARYPLGTVSGVGQQDAVAVPWRPRALVIELLVIVGGGRYVSDRMDTRPGDLIAIRIPPNIEVSSFFHRVR